MKLTKSQIKQHDKACELLQKDELTFDEKWFVLENWHEAATYDNSRNGAFFTPPMLARDFAIDVACSHRIIDICAGIGTLSFVYYHCHAANPERLQLTCVESNPLYVEVGKKLLPEANWICADIFEVWQELGYFDSVISNPPFGRVQTHRQSPDYSGNLFEYKIIDIASHIADYGSFIVPQMSAGFRYSGAPYYDRNENNAYSKFAKDTGLFLEAGCGVDTSIYRTEWKSTNIICEIACCDFTERELKNGQFSLFPEPQAMRV